MKRRLALVIAIVLVLATAATVFTACQKEKYDLSYASWNLGTAAQNNVERQMVKAFEEKFNVKVKIEENISEAGYSDSLRSLSLKNQFPDVFMIDNLGFVLDEGYAADITELVNADESGDWQKIPAALEQGAHFKSGIYAIPFAMHMQGYFVNVDLLKAAGQSDFLENEITYESFETAVKALQRFNSASGIAMGLNSEESMINWYASSQNENYGYFTWDGSQYHLDSEEFIEGIEKAYGLRDGKYTYDSLNDDDRLDGFEDVKGDVDLWDQGRLAFRWGNTYEAPDMVENSGPFEKKFIGVPGGRTVMVPDYVSISSRCSNKELAYEFAKWMSFSPEGIRKRIELNETIPNGLPLTTDMTIVNEFFDKFDNPAEGRTSVQGIRDLYTTLDQGIVEGVKIVAGYGRSRWTALTTLTITLSDGTTVPNANIGQYLDACRNGETYREKAGDINTLANQQYTNAISKYEAQYK